MFCSLLPKNSNKETISNGRTLPSAPIRHETRFREIAIWVSSISFLFPFSSSSSSLLPSLVTSFRFHLDASITGDGAKSELHAATKSSPVATATTRPWSFRPSLYVFSLRALFVRDLYYIRVMFFPLCCWTRAFSNCDFLKLLLILDLAEQS